MKVAQPSTKLSILCWIALLIVGIFAGSAATASASPASSLIEKLRNAPVRIVCTASTQPSTTTPDLRVTQRWEDNVCQVTLANRGSQPIRVTELVLMDIQHGLPSETLIFGEGFTMLGLTGGTLAKPVDWGSFPDRSHYRIAEPESLRTVYGMFELQPAEGDRVVMGFTSCNRFVGRFSFDAHRLRISYDTENLEIAPGESWNMEPLFVKSGTSQPALLDELAQHIVENVGPLRCKAPPAGWCSWSCFGAGVTGPKVMDNVKWIGGNLPALKVIQLDDGYQPHMGDWLEAGPGFGGDMKGFLKRIKDAGSEPGIWVAPFIASPKSDLLRDHPDWFIKDELGQPLPSNRVTFGGWRQGPWYVLDGTNPDVQKFLESLFHTMRTEWGCSYFKLDGIFWGAMHGGHLHDPKATRIEAYRRGMEAIRRGAGDGFILGCNHPLWPSLGLIDGSRSSNDIARSWGSFRSTAHQNLLRAWQNGRLWWNDPDCILLVDRQQHANVDAGGVLRKTEALTDDEFRFHASAILAAGGAILSGDNLPKVDPQRLQILKKLLPPTAVAAQFDDNTLQVGRVHLADRDLICLFNPDDQPAKHTITLAAPSRLTDFWSGADLGEHAGAYSVDLPPRSAQVISLTAR